MSDDNNTTVSSPAVVSWEHRREIVLRNCMLVVDAGPDAGKQFGPLKELTTIGRKLWCDLDLSDTQVSKQHCELSWTGSGWRLRDLGSSNGTRLLDGTAVHEVVLAPNARFVIGSTTLRIDPRDGVQQHATDSRDPTGTLIGASPSMQRMFGIMQRVAPSDIPILLLGETGTGKTAVASALHKLSQRKDGPFVSLNCAELAPALVESTLFGHVRGAFTGAVRNAPGRFVQAHGGTLLLDELGELPLEMQAKLLVAVESGRVWPVGADREVQVSVRLVCATNRDLAAEVAARRFRSDLFHRIAGMTLSIPPLRERASDIGMLAEWLMICEGNRRRQQGFPCHVTSLSPESIRVLEHYAWPGNVRELEHVIATAMTLAETPTIEFDDLLLSGGVLESVRPPPASGGGRPQYKDWKAALVEPEERKYFEALLAECGGSVARAAELCGLSRTHVRGMMKKHGLGG